MTKYRNRPAFSFGRERLTLIDLDLQSTDWSARVDDHPRNVILYNFRLVRVGVGAEP